MTYILLFYLTVMSVGVIYLTIHYLIVKAGKREQSDGYLPSRTQLSFLTEAAYRRFNLITALVLVTTVLFVITNWTI